MRTLLFVVSLFFTCAVHARVLHVGDNTIKLSSVKTTTPALHIKVDNEIWYGNMGRCQLPMSENTDKELKIKYNDKEYWVSEIEPTKDYVIVDGKLIAANCNIYLQNIPQTDMYIDTNVYGNGYSRVEMNVRNIDTTWISESCFFGARNTFTRKAFAMCSTLNGKPFWFMNYNDTNSSALKQSDSQKHFISFGYTGAEFCAVSGEIDNNIMFPCRNNVADFITPYTLRIFDLIDDSRHVLDVIMNIYDVKLYDNNTLVRHFVPVPCGLQIGDFVVPSNGMWDIVEQKFYGNMGSGDFIYGVDE